MGVYIDFAIENEINKFVNTVNKKGMVLTEYSKRAQFLRRKLNLVMTAKRELVQYAKVIDLITPEECEEYVRLIETKRRKCAKTLSFGY